MSNYHTVTVTTRRDDEDEPGRVAVDTVEFICSAPEDADCRTYPVCGCEVFNWNDDETADVEGHERVPGRTCWLSEWFANDGAVYGGDDYDEMRDDCVPPIARSGPIEHTFANEYPEWNWIEGQATQ